MSFSGDDFIPYGRQIIDEDDKLAVTDTLSSAWLTTGPQVEKFEKAWAEFCGGKEAVAVSNGTAALHAAMAVLDLQPGDQVIVTPMTFAASVNCVLYVGAEPLFADVEPDSLLIDPASVARLYKGNKRVKAVIPVDYTGIPCDYDAIRDAAPGAAVIADACHAPGATYKGKRAGTLGDMSCFSFHPVKHLTTAEGGAITTDNPDLAKRLRVFRNHGIDTDHRQRTATGSWFYDMSSLGFNYRLTDMQCSLGFSQLKKLPAWLKQRRNLAAAYYRLLAEVKGIEALKTPPDTDPAWHLFVVRIKPEFPLNRDEVFKKMHERKIGVNVHYRPVHLHSYYRNRFNFTPGLCPVAEKAGNEILTLPMWAGMDEGDVERVVGALEACGRGG